MNKKIITFALLLMYQLGFSQDLPIDKETNLITYSEVVEIPNVSKNDLYMRSQIWLNRTFKSSKQVIQFEDKETGKLIGKGTIPSNIKLPITGKTDAGFITMTATIIVKDGKYKFTIDNLTHDKPETGTDKNSWISVGALEVEKPKSNLMMGMGRPSKAEWRIIKETADTEIRVMITDLKKTLAKSDSDF